MKIQKFVTPILSLVAATGLLIVAFSGITSCTGKTQKEVVTRTVSFDYDWRFIKDSLINAANPDFDDSGWKILNVPHDWSIEDLAGQNGEDVIGPFDKSAIDKMSSGYTTGGIGWYRKSFTTKPDDGGKIFYLQFDGVYMNSDVWINGKHLGFHPYGYTPFFYDITEHLNQAGQKNTVAVRVKNEGLNHAGIQVQVSTGMSGLQLSILFTLIFQEVFILQLPKSLKVLQMSGW